MICHRCNEEYEQCEFDECPQCSSDDQAQKGRCCENGFFGQTHDCRKQKPKTLFGDNVIYDGKSVRIKDEKALLKKAQAICDEQTQRFAAKPDASPREKISLKEAFEVTITLFKECQAERDALAKRVAELERQLQFTNSNWPHEKKLHEELAAANETIKALRHEMRMQGGAVERETQANARIAELEVAYDCLEKVYNMNRDWIADAKEREAKLVAALEEIEAASHYADELENIRPIAIEALKAHTGGA